ncbi:hypothetical protein PSACC_02480 [Paramicrosporidium saccamoebae]|uniref:G-patch domain-containing protein n=1 Tax=Paramicrosporidium saccamoebae TaxID=1246581 RepID=A0A2H9TJ06_9FUNG|nr:hypothetical protein PSACC_02480 [Paramicrosporidium saccamoebae]
MSASMRRSLVIRGLPISASLTKGVALVSCNDTETYEALLSLSGALYIDYHPVLIEHSVEEVRSGWECQYCKASNYHWRQQCYKCLVNKSSPAPVTVVQAVELTGSQDIYVESHQISAKLERVWLVVDRQTAVSKCFAFLEYPSADIAEEAKWALYSSHGSDALTFGRDLAALNTLFLNRHSTHLEHWDPLVSLVPYPAVATETVAQPKIFTTNEPAQAKKPKIQFKPWKVTSQTETAPNSLEEEQSLRIRFFLNPVLKACFLCQVVFDSEEELEAHGKESSEHQSRVEAYKQLEEPTKVARDRAAERRELYPEEPNLVTQHEKSESFGSKILKKLGWEAGKGLGPDGSGITEPIKVPNSFELNRVGCDDSATRRWIRWLIGACRSKVIQGNDKTGSMSF